VAASIEATGDAAKADAQAKLEALFKSHADAISELQAQLATLMQEAVQRPNVTQIINSKFLDPLSETAKEMDQDIHLGDQRPPCFLP
jgi:hypothetical protein